MRADCRSIKKRTGCTEEQARYLAEEIRKYPKVKDVFLRHIDEINLKYCDEVEILPLYGYMEDSINVIGRINKGFGRTLSYGCDALFADRIFFSTY